MLFPLMLVMLIIITGCGNQEIYVMSEDNVSVSGNNASVSENALVEDVPDDELLQETGAGDNSDNGEVLQDAEKEDSRIETEPEYKTVKVKGIYVTGPIAGTEKMDELISDIEELIKKLHEKDIYVIARIVAFKDPYLAEKKPELCLKTDTGAVFRDKNGEAWVNPYKQEVWDYLAEIGAQAAKDGFDEIQFDYIRFSTDTNAKNIDYGEEAELMTKEEAITGFARYAYDKLHPLGVMVSADVFGTIIDNESDAEIVGQNYQEMATCLDYICPMVYPSHYSNGVYGLDIPDKEPYNTVYQAMGESKKKLDALTVDEEPDESVRIAGVRVWIQDFTATWLKGSISYGPDEVRAQIQAIYDAGYEEWILWNARMNYTEGALLPNWQEPETQTE